ncbi:type II toxin-antitoxin system RelE/ParE family toxin [Escherichia coli]|uniref:type II toxin-antitoxin system RelE/ParE family toxin n=1 Tax=Escherichia coli TaxID=562 RepID=UPI002041F394|nr:type II toxin-antitoxin system RelE/ParE family toxin [Escherichia coli]
MNISKSGNYTNLCTGSYIHHISDIFRILGENRIGTPRPELGEYINALPFEWHIIYFLQSDIDIIVIRILSQNQDASRHLNWQ